MCSIPEDEKISNDKISNFYRLCIKGRLRKDQIRDNLTIKQDQPFTNIFSGLRYIFANFHLSRNLL